MAGKSLTLRLSRSWDAAVYKTAEMTPLGANSALLTWDSVPPEIDAGVPSKLVEILSEVAAAIGPVAFRIFFPTDLPAGLRLIPAPKVWWPLTWYRRLTRTWQADVAVATEASAAAEMFFQDWELQGQTALVLSSEKLDKDTLALMRSVRSWSRVSFPRGVRLLLAPAVDGAGVLFATANALEMDETLARLSQASAAAGVPLINP